MNNMNKCYICNQPISDERLEGLRILGANPLMWTCLSHASNHYVKGVYTQESGTSPLIIADGIGDSRIIRENLDYPKET